jgi:hypothetical protein
MIRTTALDFPQSSSILNYSVFRAGGVSETGLAPGIARAAAMYRGSVGVRLDGES